MFILPFYLLLHSLAVCHYKSWYYYLKGTAYNYCIPAHWLLINLKSIVLFFHLIQAWWEIVRLSSEGCYAQLCKYRLLWPQCGNMLSTWEKKHSPASVKLVKTDKRFLGWTGFDLHTYTSAFTVVSPGYVCFEQKRQQSNLQSTL